MTRMASQITSLTVVYSTVYSGADQRKHQSSVSLAFVRGIHWWPVNSPHKGPVTWKTSPFDDVIMTYCPNSNNEYAQVFLLCFALLYHVPLNSYPYCIVHCSIQSTDNEVRIIQNIIQPGISNCIPQYTAKCNYLSLPEYILVNHDFSVSTLDYTSVPIWINMN